MINVMANAISILSGPFSIQMIEGVRLLSLLKVLLQDEGVKDDTEGRGLLHEQW
jgi:hypothetical protein